VPVSAREPLRASRSEHRAGCRSEGFLDADKLAGPILVLDDSPEILTLIETVLREDGFDVQTARSNDEALKKAKLAMPSLVLLDVGLPPTTDEIFVAALHELYGPRIPVVVVSAVSEPAFQRAVSRTGAADAIHKPFDISDLLAGVRRAVNGFGDPSAGPNTAFAT